MGRRADSHTRYGAEFRHAGLQHHGEGCPRRHGLAEGRRGTGLRSLCHRRFLRLLFLLALRLCEDAGAEDEAGPGDGGDAFQGANRLWTGFPTYYVRIAPHAMITLIAQDNVKKLWS